MQIYKITNLVNNKIYIGKDTSSNLNYYGSGVLIKKAINKYGLENFKKEILEECQTNQELCNREKYWISFYDSTNRLIGYNISFGGDGGDTMSKNPNLDEIKQKLSKARKGKKYEDFLPKDKVIQYKEKLSKKSKSRLTGKTFEELYGFEKSQEMKEKLSRFQKERYKNIPKKIKIKRTKEEINEIKIERLKKTFQEINDINILKKHYFGYRFRKTIDIFKKVIGEEKFNKIITELNKPFKHKEETKEFLREFKRKKFIEEKNKLIDFLKKNPSLTRNDYYTKLTNLQISKKIYVFIHGKFSNLLTEEEKYLIRKSPKNIPTLSEEKKQIQKIKLGKKIKINDIEYFSVTNAAEKLNIDRGTIRFRLKSKNYPNYQYLS